MISRSGIGEIDPANCSTDSCRCLLSRWLEITRPGSTVNKIISSKLNGQIWPFLPLCSRNDRPPALEKHVNNFWWDLFHDADKTTRSGAMNTDRITIPRSKLRKYCHGQLSQLRERPFVTFHARSRKPGQSWIHNVKLSKWRTLGIMWTLARFTNPN